MSKPTIQNVLYYHIKALLNGVLPLEYAIRAFKKNDIANYQYLLEKNEIIKDIWLKNGFSNKEIEQDKLLDLSWDLIQVGAPLYRRNNIIFKDLNYKKTIESTLETVYKECSSFLEKKSIPMIKRYRVIDLLNGNDIKKLTIKVIELIPILQKYKKDDPIPLSKFVLGKFREAIFLYPGAKFMQLPPNEEVGVTVGGYAMFLDLNMTEEDIEKAITEFKYQYATYRQGENLYDQTAASMLAKFFNNELMNSERNKEVTRVDGILSGLIGLYCYDEAFKNLDISKDYLQKAIEETSKLYPNGEGINKEESIKKNYNNVKKKIENQWDLYKNI